MDPTRLPQALYPLAPDSQTACYSPVAQGARADPEHCPSHPGWVMKRALGWAIVIALVLVALLLVQVWIRQHGGYRGPFK